MKRAAAKRERSASADAETSKRGVEEITSADVDPPTSDKRSVEIRLGGKDYRLRSDASEQSLQQVAGYVDQAMQKIRERTDTVDSLDIALLTALNLAREVLQLRDQGDATGGGSGVRLRELIEQIEAELPASPNP